jgi:hypothetical protein
VRGDLCPNRHRPFLHVPRFEQLRKRAKERLADLRAVNPSAKLADAQFTLAREYGFDSWPKLVDHIATVDPRLAEPQITAPVSRALGARDVDRTSRSGETCWALK